MLNYQKYVPNTWNQGQNEKEHPEQTDFSLNLWLKLFCQCDNPAGFPHTFSLLFSMTMPRSEHS